MSRAVAVVVGRNEGQRLVTCLESLASQVEAIIYVDSGSDDGSPERAAELGAEVCILDPRPFFTAARARNVGLEALTKNHPQVEFVQFVDGDCEVDQEWVARGSEFLEVHPEVAVVCGRRRERHPEASVFNRLVDLEWDDRVGEIHTCGGDALMRAAVVSEMGGYDPTLIAGEEIDLCLRLRQAGHHVWRLDADMVLHDVAMTRLSQWWRRQVRAGHAYAELAWRQRQYREAYWVRRLASILAWGLGPLLLAGLGLLLHPLLVAASLMAYPILWLRVYRARRRGGDAPGDASLLALGISIGKLAQLQGVVGFVWKRRILKGSQRLIEYK